MPPILILFDDPRPRRQYLLQINFAPIKITQKRKPPMMMHNQTRIQTPPIKRNPLLQPPTTRISPRPIHLRAPASAPPSRKIGKETARIPTSYHTQKIISPG